MPVVLCPKCKTKLNIPDTLAGKKAKCSSCQAVFLVPGGTGITAQQKPAPRPAATPQRRAPARATAARPKKKGGGGCFFVLLLFFGAFSFCCSFGVVVGGYFAFPDLFSFLKNDVRADLKYVPDNADFIFTYRLAKVANNDLTDKIFKEFPQIQGYMDQTLKEAEKEGVKDVSFLWKEITRITVGSKSGGNEPGSDITTGVIHTKSAFTAEKMLEKIGVKDKAKEFKAGSRTLYHVPTPPGGKNGAGDEKQFSLCSIDNHTFAIGSRKDLAAVLKRDSRATLPAEQKALFGKMDLSKDLVFVMRFPKEMLPPPGKGQPKGGPGGFQMPQVYPKYIALQASVAKKVWIQADAVFADAKEADTANDYVDLGLKAVKLIPVTPPEIKKLIGDLKITKNDKQLTATLEFDPDPLVAMAKAEMNKGPGGLLGFLGGMGGPGGKKGGPEKEKKKRFRKINNFPNNGGDFPKKGAALGNQIDVRFRGWRQQMALHVYGRNDAKPRAAAEGFYRVR